MCWIPPSGKALTEEQRHLQQRGKEGRGLEMEKEILKQASVLRGQIRREWSYDNHTI